MDTPEIVKIAGVVQENPTVKTFFIDKEIKAEPGQFLMVWLPGIDEKPFSLSYIGEKSGFTFQARGPFTDELAKLKKGDKIGIRGPYGNGFKIKSNALVIAGGIGAAPLFPLIKKLKNPDIILGAKTEEELLFHKKIKNAKITTDDGSSGTKGFTTDLFKELLKKRKYDMVYACGPEMMIKKVFDICVENRLECQASLERYMKCGFGICDQCSINCYLVCKDGPVFSSEQLRKMTELGKFARVKSGKTVSINEYAR